MKQLHHNAIVIFYIKGLIFSMFLLGFFLIVPWMLLVGLAIEGILSIIWSMLFFFFAVAIILLIPLAWAQLAYKNYRYRLTKDRVDIQRGVIWQENVSIPYERVQNVNIVRGPLTRIFGLADVQIQTAGMSGIAMIEGVIPAIAPEEAKQLKDQILSKISDVQNQGL